MEKSTKRNRIIYWIFTIWMALGAFSTGIVQIIKMKEEVTRMAAIGYPEYLLPLLGIWKVIGIVVILAPGLLLLKEWAYAGFFFLLTGAAFSHIASGNPFGEIFPSLLLLSLTMISWYFRPAERKIARPNPTRSAETALA